MYCYWKRRQALKGERSEEIVVEDAVLPVPSDVRLSNQNKNEGMKQSIK